MKKPMSDTPAELMQHAADDRLDRRASDLMDTCPATVEREVPRAWWDPTHHLLQFPAGRDVLAEGVRVQGAGDDARMVVFRCGGKVLQKEQEIRLERPPPEERKAGVVPDDRVTVAEMREDALGDRRWELERREGLVEVLG